MPEHVDAHVGGDPVQPRPQPDPILEPVLGAPGAEQRFLDGVLGLVDRAEHPVAVAGQFATKVLELLRPNRRHGTTASPAGVSRYPPDPYFVDTTRSVIA
jgi:hypothetical protein